MIEIYVQLLDEGTTTFRPTNAVEMDCNVCRLLPTATYERDEEIWEFPPGSIVECDREIKDGETVMVAKRLVKTSGINIGTD